LGVIEKVGRGEWIRTTDLLVPKPDVVCLWVSVASIFQ